jgi:hypothetical protein
MLRTAAVAATLAALCLTSLPSFAQSYPPGTLAKDRFGARNFTLIEGSNRVQLYRLDDKRGEPIPLGTPRNNDFARRLSALLRNDSLFADASEIRWDREGLTSPTLSLRFVDVSTYPATEVLLNPEQNTLSLRWVNERGLSQNRIVALDPIGEKLYALLKETFPKEPSIQALRFRPTRNSSATSLPGVSPEVMAKIKSIKPGMTRGDLFKVFQMEGGISTPLQQMFVCKDRPKTTDLQHAEIKVHVNFAPRDAQIVWVNGKGSILELGTLHERLRAAHSSSLYREDDIILSISEPFLGQSIVD